MNTYSTTQARANFSDLVNQVRYQKKTVVIGRNNKKEVLMVPYPDLTEEALNLTEMNAQSESFEFLAQEPDLYSAEDLIKRNV